MPHSYRFGEVEVRPVERQVLIEGRPASLGSRAFDVLGAGGIGKTRLAQSVARDLTSR